MSVLEACVRDVLNATAKRALCVFDPIKLVIDNYPEGQVESLDVAFHPQDESYGRRALPFSRELYIERSDFMQEPTKQYFRLSPGAEVRLRHAYVIRCTDVIFDETGAVKELRCQYDDATLGKNPVDRKVKGVIHWVSIMHAHPINILQYDRLFHDANPSREDDFMQFLNHDSLKKLRGFVEPAVKSAQLDEVFQFERLGYYAINQIDHEGVSMCHRVVDLKDTWGKINPPVRA